MRNPFKRVIGSGPKEEGFDNRVTRGPADEAGGTLPVDNGYADVGSEPLPPPNAAPGPFDTPVCVPCEKCGGLFLPTAIEYRNQVTVFASRVGKVGAVETQRSAYCPGCLPDADFVLTLRDYETKQQDTRHFRVCDLYFQDIDDKSGEDQYVTSLEEYSHLRCDDCGEVSDWEKCSKCATPAPATTKAKARARMKTTASTRPRQRRR